MSEPKPLFSIPLSLQGLEISVPEPTKELLEAVEEWLYLALEWQRDQPDYLEGSAEGGGWIEVERLSSADEVRALDVGAWVPESIRILRQEVAAHHTRVHSRRCEVKK